MKIAFAFFTYLLGTIPPGFIIFRITEKKDIRKYGSFNTGATNVLRLKGWKYALPVLIIDVLKGAIPVYFALVLFPDKRFALICAFLAVFGHCFPFYLRFNGGKGIATSLGVFAVLAFKPFLLTLAVFFLVIAITRFVSLGSILSVFSFPFFVYLIQRETEIIYAGILIFLLVLLRHWNNIQRLFQGKERKLGEKTQ
ncbi:MAG: glycerol-3-phosphate 1-O-acyltransferase PlsY [Candidatus Aminicenantes bacterium]|nr:glycerol-3-phosphate 1-O-acyltransferase PlsY [Candidatus Aminicenantes bacterium]